VKATAVRGVDQAGCVDVVGVKSCVDDRDTHTRDPCVPCPGFGSMYLTHVPLKWQEKGRLRRENTLARSRRGISRDISLSILECGYPLHHHIPFNFAVAACELVRCGVGETFYHRDPNLTM